MGTWYQQHCAIELAKLASPNVGVTTPSDVLAYRKMWDPYVLGVARANLQCSQASGLDTTLASVHKGESDDLMALWNQNAGLSDTDIVLRASGILQNQQDTVLQAGKMVPGIKRDCPKIAIPEVPSLASQQAIIGAIEGQSILANGILQLIGMGADGALQTIGAFIPGSGVNPTGALGDYVTKLKWGVGLAAVAVAIVVIGPALGAIVGGALAASKR